MIFEPESRWNWNNEFEKFMTHWEHEAEKLKDTTLDLEGCCKISDVFHKDWDGLLIRKPEEVSDDILLRIEQLDSKLNSTLAMVCSCSEENSN